MGESEDSQDKFSQGSQPEQQHNPFGSYRFEDQMDQSESEGSQDLLEIIALERGKNGVKLPFLSKTKKLQNKKYKLLNKAFLTGVQRASS